MPWASGGVVPKGQSTYNLNPKPVGVDRATVIWHHIFGHARESRDHVRESMGHGSGYLVLLSAVSTNGMMEIAMNALTWIVRHDWRRAWSVTSTGI